MGFELEDIENAVKMACKWGIRGPNGISILRMWEEMKKSDQTLSWCKRDPGKVPATLVLTDDVTNVELHFPVCDPRSGKADIRGADGDMYYFHAALLHELVHAYGRMKGRGSCDARADRVGKHMNDKITELWNPRWA
jgi:hypothetical protein